MNLNKFQIDSLTPVKGEKRVLAQVTFELTVLSPYTQSKDRGQCKHTLNSN